MSRKTRKLMWPLPGMATFAALGMLVMLVALPVGVVLAQQQTNTPPPTNLKADTGSGDRAYDTIVLTWDMPAVRSGESPPAVSGYRVDMSEDGNVWEMLFDGSTSNSVDDVDIVGKATGDTAYGNLLSAGSDDNVRFSHTVGTADTERRYRVFAKYSGEPSLSTIAGPISETTEPPQQAPSVGMLMASTPPDPDAIARDDDGKIMLTWTDLLVAGAVQDAPKAPAGTTVLGYLVQVREVGANTWTNVDPKVVEGTTHIVTDDEAMGNPYDHEDLPDGVYREYRVAAVNQYGIGRWSAEALGMTNPAEMPGPVLDPVAPSGLVAIGGSGKITLLWNSEDADADGYMIEYSETYHNTPVADRGSLTIQDADKDWTLLVVDTGSPTTMYVDGSDSNVASNLQTGSALLGGLIREYRVRAWNGSLRSELGGDYEVARAMTTAPTSVNDRPRAPVLTVPEQTSQTSKNEITITWTKAPVDEGDPDLQGHQIETASQRSGPWTVHVANQAYKAEPPATGQEEPDSRVYEHTGLTASTQYCYRVSGINAAGVGLSSDGQCVSTAIAARPPAPASVKATASSSTQIDVTWNASFDPDGAPVTGYKVEYSSDATDPRVWNLLTSNTEDEASDTTDAIETSYADTSVTAGQTRYYRVSAINSAGTGSPSTVNADSMATTPGTDAVITAPTITDVTASGNSITVTWTEGTGPSGLKHDVGLFTRDLSTFVDYSLNDADGTHTFTGVTAGDYVIFVAAYTTPDDAMSTEAVTVTVGGN